MIGANTILNFFAAFLLLCGGDAFSTNYQQNHGIRVGGSSPFPKGQFVPTLKSRDFQKSTKLKALDVASLSGGAVTAYSSANGLLASLTETGFYQAFSLVFVSEIGDKTFFMAGLLAMKTSKFISFLGSMGALFVMTIISVLIGQTFHVVPAGFGEGFLGGLPLDDVAAVLAFAFFGFKTLQEALTMEEGESVMDEEFAEAEEEVEASDTTKQGTIIARILSIFGLVFAAEFGDRSFLSTIALSAAQNPFSVGAGAIAAHAIATGIAVSGGAVLAKYLSERVIGIIGGALFIVFAITTALGIF
ncbi:unnamed protein product [Pseudo-nitzschia multistriata]|uniref:GDT1 family protein n=1 Tax=Pseudo-nitzschia multistriata TaxID=183589 RepID=A0A448ZRI3_9STRA|nr:unnamed protein product [Pseudo-nitzschia multistriata]